MKLRLDQSIPWSNQEIGGFAISAILSSVIFTFLMAWATAGAGRAIEPPVLGLLMLLGISLLNTPPIKHLPGSVQYLLCMASTGTAHLATTQYPDPTTAVLSAVVGGFVVLCTLRVNWWAWWDYPSRRTVGQRMAASIFFTALPFLGFAFGFWRLVFGIGLHDVTTQFVTDPDAPNGQPLETIIEDPALAEHARRMEAVRAAQTGVGSGRKSSEEKGAVSESI